jgi:hypothetical protein
MKISPSTALSSKDLLGIEELSKEEIEMILETAEGFKEVVTRTIKKVPTLRGKHGRESVLRGLHAHAHLVRTGRAPTRSADVINFDVATSSAWRRARRSSTRWRRSRRSARTTSSCGTAARARPTSSRKAHEGVRHQRRRRHARAPDAGAPRHFTIKRKAGRIKRGARRDRGGHPAQPRRALEHHTLSRNSARRSRWSDRPRWCRRPIRGLRRAIVA